MKRPVKTHIHDAYVQLVADHADDLARFLLRDRAQRHLQWTIEKAEKTIGKMPADRAEAARSELARIVTAPTPDVSTDVTVEAIVERPRYKGTEIVGYADAIISALWDVGSVTFKPGGPYGRMEFVDLSYGAHIVCEVKPAMDSFGATLRQMRRYLEALRHEPGVFVGCVLSPDTSWARAFEREEEIHFVALPASPAAATWHLLAETGRA